jgi:hypothetical protein
MNVTETAEDKGKRKMAIQVAKQALQAGASIEFIAQITPLIHSEIEQLASGIDIDKEDE